MELIITIIIAGIFVFYGTLSWGLCLYKFWYWFIVPIFPAVPHIGYWQAVGLMLFVELFKSAVPASADSDTNERFLSYTIIAPWITLVVGWLFSIIIL